MNKAECLRLHGQAYFPAETVLHAHISSTLHFALTSQRPGLRANLLARRHVCSMRHGSWYYSAQAYLSKTSPVMLSNSSNVILAVFLRENASRRPGIFTTSIRPCSALYTTWSPGFRPASSLNSFGGNNSPFCPTRPDAFVAKSVTGISLIHPKI